MPFSTIFASSQLPKNLGVAFLKSSISSFDVFFLFSCFSSITSSMIMSGLFTFFSYVINFDMSGKLEPSMGGCAGSISSGSYSIVTSA